MSAPDQGQANEYAYHNGLTATESLSLVRSPIVYNDQTDDFISGRYPRPEQRRNFRDAVAQARVTGSVGATYNGVKVKRLYIADQGVNVATTLWVLIEPTP